MVIYQSGVYRGEKPRFFRKWPYFEDTYLPPKWSVGSEILHGQLSTQSKPFLETWSKIKNFFFFPLPPTYLHTLIYLIFSLSCSFKEQLEHNSTFRGNSESRNFLNSTIVSSQQISIKRSIFLQVLSCWSECDPSNLYQNGFKMADDEIWGRLKLPQIARFYTVYGDSYDYY